MRKNSLGAVVLKGHGFSRAVSRSKRSQGAAESRAPSKPVRQFRSFFRSLFRRAVRQVISTTPSGAQADNESFSANRIAAATFHIDSAFPIG
jgi:hypothetical protein